ncbi:MAG: glycosyltransferase family 2 protein, partial [Candidatus Bathyarchaeia archaeon]
KIINSIFRAGAKKISDTQSGYRAYSIKALSLVRPIESGMGASVEILLKAEQNKLRIKEIPIRIYYKVEQPSKVNPVVHALDVILTTLKHKSIRHPLMFYGGPGAVSIVTALTTGLLLVQIFNESRYFSLPLAILTVGFSLIGIVLCSTAIILWILVSLIREMKE